MNRYNAPTSRRAFLKAGATALAGAAVCPERLLADPYAPLAPRRGPRAARRRAHAEYVLQRRTVIHQREPYVLASS